MTPRERVFLQQVGNTLLRTLAESTAIVLLQGILIGLFSISIYISINRRRSGTLLSTWVTLTVTTLGFLICCVYCATVAFFHLSLLIPIFAPEVIIFMPIQLTNMIVWLAQLLPIVNDGLIVWRSWVVSAGRSRRWVVYVVSVLWLVVITTTFAELGLIVSNPNYMIHGANWIHFYTATTVLSLCTNFLATAAIAYTLWSHRKFLLQTLGHKGQRRSDVVKVLTLLTESGTFYCILQFMTLIMTLTAPSLSEAPAVGYTAQFFSIFVVLSAMYLPLVNCLIKWTVLPTTTASRSDESLG